MSSSPSNLSSRRLVTVVAPVHNEAQNIPVLASRLAEVARTLPGWDVQLLLVDDGSRDSSVATIERLRREGMGVGLVRLSRNFGHQAALQAGLLHAAGDAVVSMDSDLQHPPEELPRMLAALDEGADVVQMVRAQKTVGMKGMLSRGFYRIFQIASGAPIVADASDFRLLSRRFVDALNHIPEREKFLRGMVPMLGFRQVQLHFDEARRLHGTPSYSFRRSFRLGMKAMFDFSTVPLQVIFWLGLTMAIASFSAGIVSIVVKLVHKDKITPGYTDTIVAILFLSGTILFSVGVLGRYLMMILEQVRGRPAFVVMETLAPMPLTKTETSEAAKVGVPVQ
jgi:polyisoprenyl-phosphate glycosyltransferase